MAEKMQPENTFHPADASRKADVFALIALMLLLGLAVLAAWLPLGAAGPVIGLCIATIKAIIIASIFMKLRIHTGVTRLFAAAGVLWLVILLGLTLSDYLTRT